MTKNSHTGSQELRQFVERIERLEEDKQAVMKDIKEVKAEAKGRGYDIKALNKILAERKQNPDDVAELEAVVDLYRHALGMTGADGYESDDEDDGDGDDGIV